jgi:tetratricopeptide (TPR) repeat protein
LLRHPLKVAVLLFGVILAVYYPAFLSGVHPIDDSGIIAYYSASPSLSSILLPGTGFYYRPLLEFSYYLDNRLWGMEPGVMHLENIMLHCANSLLVFLLARRICRDDTSPWIPVFSAFLFSLHPVNVEAVAWIAGRTDPLLALFVLSASCYWLNWLEKPRWQYLSAALLLFAAALLTKESALAFGAVAILLVLSWPGDATKRQRLKAVGIMIALVMSLVILALVFRSGTSGLGRFISTTNFQVAQGAWEALIALGFYVRKLLVPFPLNFAISSVHQMYGLLGVVLFPALWLVYHRYRLSGILFISAVFFFTPAILVAMKQITWTSFAERYLYLSTAFFALGMVRIVDTWNRMFPVALPTFIIVLLCGIGLGDFQRNILWKDKLSFFQDAVAKSPDFGSVYFSLGGEFIKNSEFDRAAEAFATADRLNKRVSMRYPIKASIMETMLAKGKLLEARVFFFQTFRNKWDAPADFLELLYKADGRRLEIIGNKERHLLAQDLLETLDLLNQKKPDPFWLYRSGQISLILGDDQRSADFFRRSFTTAPHDAHYRPAAQKYLQRLERAE